MKKAMTFIEVLEDRTEGGSRSMIDSIEEYISDIKNDPKRYEGDYKFGLENTVKELQEKTGYKYDLSDLNDFLSSQN